MTIVVGVAAPDGLILAADSRTTLSPAGATGRTRVGSDSVQKVFALCGSYGVACYGVAFIEDKTVAGQIDEFEASLSSQPTDVAGLGRALGAFFEPRVMASLAAAERPWQPGDEYELGFLIAGYDDLGIGQLLDVRVPAEAGHAIIESGLTTSSIGATWRGQDDVVNRLMGGVDATGLAASGVSVPSDVERALTALEYNLIPPLTVQDAIDFAAFFIRTTIDMQRFSDGTRASPAGVPGCGGPVRILHVARGKTDWIARPALTAGEPPGRAEASIRAQSR
jgi:hypothetical protein